MYTETEQEVLQYVNENDVKFIKLFFTDIFGILRSISIMPDFLEQAFSQGVPFNASAIKGFLQTTSSDLFLKPDPKTLAVLPWRPQQGRVVRLYCDIVYPDGTPFEGDTRHVLKQCVEEIKSSGYGCYIRTKCEFYLFEQDENGYPTKIPHDQAGYCALAPEDRGENVRRDICLTLEQLGLHPEISYHEKGPGQHEIDFKYGKAFEAADDMSSFKNTVQTIASRNGLAASFCPKPLPNFSGSGFHINIALTKDGKSLFDSTGTNTETKAFIAGILQYIREITAFLNPLRCSYSRFGAFEAPRLLTWSSQNHSQLIRIPSTPGEFQHIEIRSPDPSCNHYLAFTLLLRAGMEGIRQNLPLDLPLEASDWEKDTVPAEKKLPSSLVEALRLAADSPFVASILPRSIVQAYVEAKTSHEDSYFGIV